jgi:transcription initiation factor TFIIIB Brf1 subunit/transcription initiation factor TFIIB
MLDQVCGRLRAGERVRLRALEIAREARKESVSSAYPSLAAAAFFIACRENGIRITQEEIACTFNITAVTLRNVLRRMRERGIMSFCLKAAHIAS